MLDTFVVGRTRLQKTIKLLQRLGLPTDYTFNLHFYGPYSEGLRSDIRLLAEMGLGQEEQHIAQDGSAYFVLKASPDTDITCVGKWRTQIQIMNGADPRCLELAATYDAFRAEGSDHHKAIERLRNKKPTKCTQEYEERALALLTELGLPSS